MKHLYAPWRTAYAEEGIKTNSDKSVFTAKLEENNDNKNLILKRYDYCAVMLNLYPYNAGHLLVVPFRQVSTLTDLGAEELHELMHVITQSCRILKATLGNPGTNVGINMGDPCSGGSIPQHLHVHIVPRWPADTGFLNVVADTKVVSVEIKKIFEQLKAAF